MNDETKTPLGLGSTEELGLPARLLAARQSLRRHDATMYDAPDGHSLYSEAAAEIERLRDKLAEWRKLLDPAYLHANLLRGLPAQLDSATFMHLAGEAPNQPETEAMVALGPNVRIQREP